MPSCLLTPGLPVTCRAIWNCNSSWTVLPWLFMLCFSMIWATSVALDQPGGQQAASCTLKVSGDMGRLQHVWA